MDTVHPDDSNRVLPSARELLMHGRDPLANNYNGQQQDPNADKMQIDEPSFHPPETTEHTNGPVAFTSDSVTKPHLPSITNAQPCSPIPHPANATGSPSYASDEYLRHRMSDMSVSSSSIHPTGGATPRAMSPAYEPNNNSTASRPLSPLEPSSQTTPSHYESYSRRGSMTDFMFHNSNNSGASPLEFRRPTIPDLNNLPLPTSSANASRRGSLATVITDYDYPSRSPSPAPYNKPPPNTTTATTTTTTTTSAASPMMDYGRRDSLPFHPTATNNSTPSSSYDPFQRRHSIATAEVPNSNRAPTSKYRAFRFPATIPESPSQHGPYSAPSSPPDSSTQPTAEAASSSAAAATNAHVARYARPAAQQYHHPSSDVHPHFMQQQQRHHPYSPSGPVLHHRRRSIMMDELGSSNSGPILARRASMPVVSTGVGSSSHQHRSPHDPDYYASASNSSAAEDERSQQRRSETPYSRSPELRVSHKLAERKRRKEMKELFDELRDSLPVEKNLKTSKWEILSKAIEYITLLKRRDFEMENEVALLRREVSMLKRDRGVSSSNYGPQF
ncbi:hypothetical protein RO3G_13996 [Lichtheimia corymbifera JMRC:FSU:9682]|uniref:BHLH domain-containing protein n=1 Tax=Lichtheimia corymbifera JMRC:FSU:9682 TaxID=1263082 RepID=A0A068RWZ0_9FUNG|nr:hypothetical protein RO3G_13996 [Lichtheimia corymbifera JMRC:FSU:9682]